MTKFENELTFGESRFYYCDLKKVSQHYPKVKKLPNILKILLETNLRNNEDANTDEIIKAFENRNHDFEITYNPSRILMQDLTGIPVLVEFAMLRDFLKVQNKNEKELNPQIMIDLIVDHSMISESVGTKHSLNANLKNEIDENIDKYRFLKWASQEFENLNVVPPGFGVGHQINLEFLSTMISVKPYNEKQYMIPETLAGTDLHTSMINSMGILAWKIEELDSLTLMLGASITLKIPKVLGVKLVGVKDSLINFSDVVLNLVDFIKEKEIDYDFIEFFGEAIKDISLENRATISNMANELGVKCAYFSVDDETIKYASKTRNVDASFIKDYYKRQDLYFKEEAELDYDEVIEFDMSMVKSAIAGPRNPYTKVNLEKVASKLQSFKRGNILRDNDIVIASITSCLATSNPYLMVQAGLLARNAVKAGLSINPNIKTSFAAGSPTVKNYLQKLGLLEYLEKLGFGIVGYGCGVCAGNSGHLFPNVESEINQYKLNVSSVSSGNQNFNSYIHPMTKSNWLMSPALVIAYSIKGSVNFNIKTDMIAKGVYLKDIWPKDDEVNKNLDLINYSSFPKKYNSIFLGDSHWQEIETIPTSTYLWNEKSTYVKPLNYFDDRYLNKININRAQIMMILGDNVSTTDLMPAKNIAIDSITGEYLKALKVHPDRYGTYEKRKANYEILLQSICNTENIKNSMVKKEGAFTKDFQTEETVSLLDYSNKYKNKTKIFFVGKNFANGENFDTIAKAFRLIDLKVIICESMSDDFRKALIKFGILPLQLENQTLESLNLVGNELINIFTQNFIPNEKLHIEIIQNSNVKKVLVRSLLNTLNEIIYFKNGGIVSYLIKN